MSFIAGDYREVIRQEMREQERYIQAKIQNTESNCAEEEVEDTDQEDTVSLQTFPDVHASVVRQNITDLTCGMRCLQNMYGQHIVTREEMDNVAKDLERYQEQFAN